MKAKYYKCLLIHTILFVSLWYAQIGYAQINSFPFTTDFEDWTPCGAGGCNVDCSGAVMNGWVQETNGLDDDQDWRVDSDGTGSNNTGPSVDHTIGDATGLYIYTEASGCNNQISNLISPEFDISALTNPVLSFYFHMAGADMGTMNVDVTTNLGITWTNVWTQTGAVQLDETDPWIKVDISLIPYIAFDSLQFRFQGITGPDFESDMALDDIEIKNVLADDIGISNLLVSQTSPSSCGYSVNETVTVRIRNFGLNAQMNFPISYSIDGGLPVTQNVPFNIPADSSIFVTFSTPADLSGVGANVVTAWTGLPSDAVPSNDTLSDAFANVIINADPYTEDFESFVACATTGGAQVCPVSNGWYQDENGVDDDNDWRTDSGGTTSTGTGPSDDNTLQNGTGNYMYIEASTTFDLVSNLISPCLDLDAYANPAISFYYHMFGIDMGTLNVDISDDDGATWTNLWSQNGQVQTASTDPWIQQEILLAGYSGIVLIRFQGIAGSDFNSDMAIDDFSLFNKSPDDIGVTAFGQPANTCALSMMTPIEVVVTNFSTNSQSNFPVSYRVNGGPVTTELFGGTLAASSSSTFLFTTGADLSTQTSYLIEAWTTLAVDSDNTNDSAQLNIVNAGVIDVFPYVEDFESTNGGWFVTGTNPSWEWGIPNNSTIDTAFSGQRAWVTGLDATYNLNEVSYLTSPCFDLTGLPPGDPVVSFGLNYVTEVNFDEVWLEFSTDGGISWTKVPAATGSENWYNDVINEFWEGDSGGWLTAKTSVSGIAGEPNVQFRFVMSSDISVNLEGVGIDLFQISEPLLTDVGVISIQPFDFTCSLGMEPLDIVVKNFSSLPIDTIPVGYMVNGGSVVWDTIFVSIDPDSTQDHTFSQLIDFSLGGDYEIVAFTGVIGDQQLNNDTASIHVETAFFKAPYSENFDDFSTCSVANAQQNCDLDDGWVQGINDVDDLDDWRVDNGGTSSPNTGPLDDHTLMNGTGNYVYLETSGPVPGFNSIMTSPCIDLDTISAPVLIFYYHMFGDSMGTLNVSVSTDNAMTFTQIWTQSGPVQTNQSDDWELALIDLSAFAGNVIKVRFEGIAGPDFTSDMAIDDLYVGPVPQCLNPGVNCNDITVALDEDGLYSLSLADSIALTAGTVDTCGAVTTVFSRIDFDCTDIGTPVDVTISYSFAAGFSGMCTGSVTVVDEIAPDAICNDITINYMNDGTQVLTSADSAALVAGTMDACTEVTASFSQSAFDCAVDGTQTTINIMYIDGNGNTSNCTSIITLLDTSPPTPQCNDITIFLDDTGNQVLTASDSAAIVSGTIDNCGSFMTTFSVSSFSCADIGNPVTIVSTYTDASGNTSNCTSMATVLDVAPVPECADITIYLDLFGNYTLSASDSMTMVGDLPGNCARSSFMVSFSQNDFDCTDVGGTGVPVSITLMDGSGNSSNCTSTVMVADSFPPFAFCFDINVPLNNQGISLVPIDALLNAASFDMCDGSNLIASYSQLDMNDDLLIVDCSYVGPDHTEVPIYIWDQSGNMTTCIAGVQADDLDVPVAVCNDITIDIGEDLEYTLSALDSAALVAGTLDNCELAVVIQPSSFSCDQLGLNVPVDVTVADQDGNEVTCTAVVFVDGTPASTILYVDEDATGNNDGTTWTDAFTNLSSALDPTNAGSCGGPITEIWVAEGTYSPTDSAGQVPVDVRNNSYVMLPEVGIYGGFNGTETMRDQRDATMQVTTLDGQMTSYHVVQNKLNGLDHTAILDGFVITGGNANGVPADGKFGGGMYNHQSSPSVNNCRFEQNNANFGGGMLNRESDTRVTNCYFIENTAAQGGGMFNWKNTTSEIVNCIFSQNEASKDGGAMMNNKTTTPTIINSSMSANMANRWGGGIFTAKSSTTTVTNSILWDNIPEDMRKDGTSTETITYSDISTVIPGIGNISADPLFVNSGSHDLQLLLGSPVINAGNNADVPGDIIEDIDGDMRIQGSDVDMGAHEGFTGPVRKAKGANKEPIAAIYPNPTTGITTITMSNVTAPVKWTLYDARGRIVRRGISVLPIFEMDISDLPTQPYTIILKTNEGAQSKRIVKIGT